MSTFFGNEHHRRRGHTDRGKGGIRVRGGRHDGTGMIVVDEMVMVVDTASDTDTKDSCLCTVPYPSLRWHERATTVRYPLWSLRLSFAVAPSVVLMILIIYPLFTLFDPLLLSSTLWFFLSTFVSCYVMLCYVMSC